MGENDSGLDNEEETKDYVAAIRFYIDTNKVHFISTSKIQKFDITHKKFPYDANVENGLDPEGEIIFEPAIILDVSDDKNNLMNKEKRWLKPTKRRSVVLYELAKKAEKADKSKKSTKPVLSLNSTDKDVPPSINYANDNVHKKLLFTNNLEFDDDEDKDQIIENLRNQLKELQDKNKSAKSAMPVEVRNNESSPRGKHSVPVCSETIVNPCTVVLTTLEAEGHSGNNMQLSIKSPPSKCFARASTSRFVEKEHYYSDEENVKVQKKNRAQYSGLKRKASRSIHNQTSETATSSNSLKPSFHEDMDNIIEYKEAIPKKMSKEKSKREFRLRTEKNESKFIRKEVKKDAAGNKNADANKKYKRKIKKIQYDTDDYTKSDLIQREKLTTWEKGATDGQPKMTMFHLHYGVSIPRKAWRKAKKASSSYKFIRELYPHLWKLHEFVKLAVQIDRTKDTNGREPIDSRLFEALKKSYVQYLFHKEIITQEMSTKQQAKHINKFGRFFGTVIAQEREKFFRINSRQDSGDDLSESGDLEVQNEEENKSENDDWSGNEASEDEDD
ncbi:uncharacterized protein LOC131675499 isoform X2 [Phymastichus coffea]|uniref:uncharacterized protein LOC131671811 isoform X2 n=1 Tax=Phymastichus coffea TaxID=108790 RepID=UPI00273C7343|nr:uncharacterized protein LOC131671811 isoform X2 [Phymastichus coffea]XP_058810487.1 uncharacterized protein LOC131675499 isoform X2 [Phymastichus coffea]